MTLVFTSAGMPAAPVHLWSQPQLCSCRLPNRQCRQIFNLGQHSSQVQLLERDAVPCTWHIMGRSHRSQPRPHCSASDEPRPLFPQTNLRSLLAATPQAAELACSHRPAPPHPHRRHGARHCAAAPADGALEPVLEGVTAHRHRVPASPATGGRSQRTPERAAGQSRGAAALAGALSFDWARSAAEVPCSSLSSSKGQGRGAAKQRCASKRRPPAFRSPFQWLAQRPPWRGTAHQPTSHAPKGCEFSSLPASCTPAPPPRAPCQEHPADSNWRLGLPTALSFHCA